jgi:hypothetical protein
MTPMREHNREFKKIFSQTQTHLGNAEPDWTYAPILIKGSNHPETTCNPDTRLVQVRVTVSTLNDPMQRSYQLIHESVHCLSPRNRRDTLFFEEGLANWYALTIRSLPESYRQENEGHLVPLLKRPFELFRQLKPSYEKVAALRKDCVGLDDVTEALIEKHFACGKGLATQLMERLPEDRPAVM